MALAVVPFCSFDNRRILETLSLLDVSLHTYPIRLQEKLFRALPLLWT